MKTFFQKTLIIFIALSIFVTAIPKAHAITTVESGGNLFTNILNTIETGLSTELDIAGFITDVLIAELKKKILDKLVDQVIEWIQGGGKPQFITDYKGFFEDIGQEAVGTIAQELDLGFLCEPFSLNIKLAVGVPPVKRFSKTAECTLDKIVGNIGNFYNDFRNGGWLAFSEAWQPQNNYYGGLLLARVELEDRIAGEQGRKTLEILANGGFLDTKDENGQTITPGSVGRALVSKAIGSDIDLLVNLEGDVANIVAAIIDAAINRVVTEGLAKASKSEDRPDDPCVFLTGSALDACRSSQANSQNTLNIAKQRALDKLEQVLKHFRAVQNTADATVAVAQRFIGEFEGLIAKLEPASRKTQSDFGFGQPIPPICDRNNDGIFNNDDKNALLAAIQQSINREQNEISAIGQDQELQDNLDKINNLEELGNAVSQSQSLDQLAIFNSQVNQQASSDQVTAAADFKNQKVGQLQTKQNQITQRSETDLEKFNEEINTCYLVQ